MDKINNPQTMKSRIFRLINMPNNNISEPNIVNIEDDKCPMNTGWSPALLSAGSYGWSRQVLDSQNMVSRRNFIKKVIFSNFEKGINEFTMNKKLI